MKNLLSPVSSDSRLLQVLKILPHRDQVKLIQATFVQVALNVLDLLGVFLIGGLAAIAFRGAKSEGPGDRTSTFLSVVGLENATINQQLIALGVLAVFALCTKTFLSIIFLRKILFFLSKKSADSTSILVSKLISQPKLFGSSKSIQEYIYSVTTGIANLTTGVYGSLVQIVSDVGLLLILIIGLLYIDPFTSLATFFVFVAAGLILFQVLQAKTKKLGSQNAKLVIESNQLLVEAFSSTRELLVKNANFFYSARIRAQRSKLATFDAELKFLPNISKYVSEIVIVVGILLMTMIQFTKSDTNHAVAVVSVFMAASARIAPAVMRIQQNAVTVRTYLASSESAFELFRETATVKMQNNAITRYSETHEEFLPEISLKHISFKYGDSEKNALTDVDFQIEPGTLSVIVGPSGSGKSTLVDLIIGVLEPTAGRVEISRLTPGSALVEWPGALGLVPQTPFVINGSIRENICMGIAPEFIPETSIWEALKLANLDQFVLSNSEKLDYQVGENGNRLSGGQKQRLVIARALLTKPRILILDEATSSLDAESESRISEALEKLRGQVTIISVAHRLSVARTADKVYYFEDGILLESGTFDQVRNSNKNFATQVKMMGL